MSKRREEGFRKGKEKKDIFGSRKRVFGKIPVTGGRGIFGEHFFLFACKEAFEAWTLLIIFTILRDIFVCFFLYESQAIRFAFTNLWDDYGFVVIVIS